MNKVIYYNDTALNFNRAIVKAIIDNELFDYSQADRDTIISCIMFIADELDVSGWKCFEENICVERYLIDAVIAYLNDNHSVYQLYTLEDDTEIFDYLK